MLCRLISLYGRMAQTPKEEETWIRSPALSVLIYECISTGILDFDYAPCLVDISHKGSTKKVWMNISQEAAMTIDELRIHGMVSSVRMYTEDYKAITSYQVSTAGLRMIKAVPSALHDELKHVVYVPDKENTYSDIVQIGWDDKKEIFYLRSGKSGYRKESQVTEIEDVSYVCSPYIPKFLLRSSSEVHTTDNSGRAAEAFAGQTNIKDGDLMEAISLGHLRMLLAEWVPFGSNSILSTAMNLGAMDRCKHGMFSSKVDVNPVETNLQTSAGVTAAKILDFDIMKHINMEAEINYPEDEGIVQVEFFGIHINTFGNILFGITLESIMTRRADDVSIDLLTRMSVDVVQDSSRILNDIMNSYQRELMRSIFEGNSDRRSKFACYLCKSIDPWFASSAQYLDRGDHENELAQILGQIRFGRDLGDKHFLFMGTIGVLLIGSRAHEFDSYLVPFCNLQGMMTTASRTFEQLNHICHMLDEAISLSETTESSPFVIDRVQYLVSRSGSEAAVLDLVIKQLSNAVEAAIMPPEPRDLIGIKLFAALRCRQWQDSLRQRTDALKRLIQDSKRKSSHLRSSAYSVNNVGLHKAVTNTGLHVQNLIKLCRKSHETGSAIWVVTNLFAVLLLMRFLDKFRWGSSFCEVAEMNQTILNDATTALYKKGAYGPGAHVLGSTLYVEPTIYSTDCDWINPLQQLLDHVQYIFVAISVIFAVFGAVSFDKISFLIQKRRRKAIARYLHSWISKFGSETFGRQLHRVDVMSTVNVDALESFLEPKLKVNVHHEMVAMQHNEENRTKVFVQWQETDPVSWLGVPPLISVLYGKESSYLYYVKFHVHTRLTGLKLGDLWDVLQRQLQHAGVMPHDAAVRLAHAAQSTGPATPTGSPKRAGRNAMATTREWAAGNNRFQRVLRRRRSEAAPANAAIRARLVARFRNTYRPSLWTRLTTFDFSWASISAVLRRPKRPPRPARGPADSRGAGKPVPVGSGGGGMEEPEPEDSGEEGADDETAGRDETEEVDEEDAREEPRRR